jgi:putative cell wall-binding protein
MHLVTPPLRRVSTVLLALVLALPLLAGLTASAGAQSAEPYANLSRVDGDDFVSAGVRVSRALYPEKASAAVLATTANFPDALSSSALAAKLGAPILFTDRDALPQATADELRRVLEGGAEVVLMGGVDAITDQVRDRVRQLGFTTARVSGRTRLETAAAAAREIGLPESGTVVIARAFGGNAQQDRTTGWVDSVSCGGHAARTGTPVLLTETSRLSGTTAAVLGELGARRAIVCGGTGAVSEAVVVALRERGMVVQRVAGRTRVETAVAAAQDLFGFRNAGGRQFVLVNGYDQNFGYGLAATQLSGRRNAPILLVGATEPTGCQTSGQASNQTLCYLGTAGQSTARVTVVGSTRLVSQAVADAAAAAAGGRRARPLAAPSNVRVAPVQDDGSKLTVQWDGVANPDGTLAGYNVYVGEGSASTRQGSTPTAGAGTTTYTVENLKPATTYTVQVAAVDSLGRESQRSGAQTGTTGPVSAVRDFTATAGNGQVNLTWGANPEPSVSEYRLQRAATSNCGSLVASYGDLEGSPVTGRTTTTFTDSTAQNGTAYCYRIRAYDGTNDRTSGPATAGPATPSVTPLAVTVNEPAGGATLRAGTTATIRYTISGAAGSLADADVILAYSRDGGATYTEITRRKHGVTAPEGTHTWAVPDVDSVDPGTPGSSPGGRVRVTVFEAGGDERSTENRSGAFSLRRAPSAPTSAAAVADGQRVRLTWDANPETTVTGYRILRKVVTVTSSTNSDQACSEPFGSYSERETVQGRSTTTFVDTDVTPNTATSQRRYCYQVIALRTGDGGSSSPSSTTSATVAAVAAPGVALQKPENGETIRTNRGYTIRYTVTVPSGSSADRVLLDYCVDYDTGTRLMDDSVEARCRSGWQRIGTGSAEAGDRSLAWSVPSSIGQGDGRAGAIRARIYATAGQAEASPSNTSVRTGILFR